VVCDGDVIGDSGDHCGGNDAHLDCINELNHGALGSSTRPARCFSTSSPA
jgi:hypothetical protein